MRGVPHDPVFRAKLMALHGGGMPLSELSREYGIARPVLSRWWARYQVADVAGLMPHSRRPHRSPGKTAAAELRRILHLRAQGLSAARIGLATAVGYGTVQRTLERAGSVASRGRRSRDRSGTKSNAPASSYTSMSSFCRR